jgi:hypothetical protein
MSQADVFAEINDNIVAGQSLGLSFDPKEYLSGEHSGLLSTPQQPIDNPNFVKAVSQAKLVAIGADASRETGARKVGTATTVPRHPVAVYYNVATQAQEISEYNYFYTSAAAGGSGNCDSNPLTCLPAPLGATGYTDYIVPTDAVWDLKFILSNDPRPFYAHVSNLAGDRIAYPLLERILATYRAGFSNATPLVNLNFTQAAQVLTRQTAWAAAGLSASPSVTGFVQDGAVQIASAGSTQIPLTVPEGTKVGGAAFGESYGGERSGWITGNLTATLPGTSITSPASATFAVGTAGTFTVTATGGSANAGTPSLAVTGALPSGVTFVANVNGTGTLSGTPAAGTGGVYPLSVVATDATGTTTQAFTLTVNQPPTFTSAATANAGAGAAYTLTVTTSGTPKPTITRTGTLPPGLSFVDNKNGTATISGKVGSSAGGNYVSTLTATNSVGTATQTLTITVGAGPSIAAPGSGSVKVGVAFSKTFTFKGTPAPAITVSGPLPAGITFSDLGTGSAVLSGTPIAGSGGVYKVSITGTNTYGSATGTYTLTVNEGPKFTGPTSATLTRGTAATVTVKATGQPLPSITRSGTLPRGMTYANSTKGVATISGTPTRAGSYVLTLTATNSYGAVTETFTITVV